MHRSCRPLLLSLIALAVAVGPAVASPARDELLRYVPEDVGFCLVVKDLRGHAARLLASPLAKALQTSKLAAMLTGSPEWKQLTKTEGELKKYLGIGLAGLRDDILGDALVFAWRPGPAGKPDEDQGLVLVRARNAKALAALVKKINDGQKATGELKGLSDRTYKGVKYVQRKEKKENTYYLLAGSVLLFTGQERFLHQAIETHQALPVKSEPPLTKRLKLLGLDAVLAALLVNPRAFDAVVAAGAGKTAGGKAFVGCWKALESAAVSLQVDKDIRLGLTLRAKEGQLPAAARKLFAGTGRASALWSVVPDDALIAKAGRVDLPALYALAGEFMSKTSKKTLDEALEGQLGAVLGKSVVKEVLPAIGPDWGMWLVPPPADAKGWAPRGVWAVKVARGEENDPVDEALLSAMHTWGQLVVLGHNKAHPTKLLSLKRTTLDKVSIRYLSGDKAFPEGWQPAWALKAGYLVLATSPAEIKGFRAPAPTKAGGDAPLLRISFKNWRAYLKSHRDGLAGALAAKEAIDKKKALERIDAVRGNLELLESLEVRQKTATGQVSWSVVLKTTQALRKAE